MTRHIVKDISKHYIMKKTLLTIIAVSSLIFGSCTKESVETKKQQTVEEYFLSHTVASCDTLVNNGSGTSIIEYKFYNLNTKVKYNFSYGSNKYFDSLYREIYLNDTFYFFIDYKIGTANCNLYKYQFSIDNKQPIKQITLKISPYRVYQSDEYSFINHNNLYKFNIVK